ncbi:MAG: hypothetical protein ABH800_00705 [Candidatus Nealsonbacteria bacterium]
MNQKGIITTYVLVFGAIFLLLLSGLLGYILLQLKQSNQRLAWNESLHIAEAGIDYYNWCLNNEAEGNCLTEGDYFDAEGNSVGGFSLEIVSTTACGETIKREIISTGWTNKFPNTKRKIKVLYARVSVAEYAYLLNDSVWAGADREISGLYHSNGGIRMDGENQSLVTSAQEEWVCTSSFGCSSCPTGSGCRTEGSNCICPGVFTTTENSREDLFEFPVPPFDFDGIIVDLASIKSITESFPQEKYWPRSTDIDPEGKGYHVVFKNDGTFEVRIITSLGASWACHNYCSSSEDWYYDYFTINSEYQYGASIPIDSACSLVFFEDNLWVEGEVKGKITLASADLINPTEDTDVVLPGNINYTTLAGSDGLAVIGERNISIGPGSPNQMELRGIFIAQKGNFGRNMYWWNIKEKLEVYGSIVSNGRVGTQWTSGSSIVSGYQKRENYIDAELIYSPPPFIPYTEFDFKIINWEELE